MKNLNLRHLRLIGSYSTRHAVRGGAGIVYLLLAMFFSLIVAQIVLTPVEAMINSEKKAGRQADPAAIVEQVVDFGRGVVTWALAPDSDSEDEVEQERIDVELDEWSDYLMDDKPALLSAIFLILLFGMPLVLPFGAFNQTAGEIGNRGLRYMLLRTERGNIFLGRFISTVLFTLIVNAFSIATITLYVGLKLKIYGGWELSTWAMQGYLALSLQALPYIALCAWISAANEGSMLSLVVCSLAIGGVALFAFLGAKLWGPAHYLDWLLPWNAHHDLIHHEVTRVAKGGLICVAYTGAYLFLGHRHFSKRDL